MRTIPCPSFVHVAQDVRIPLSERVSISLAAVTETAREGLLAFCVGVGLSVVAEIFEEGVTQLVGPRGKHDPGRKGYRHGQEDRQLTLGGRRVGVQKPRARTKAGEEVELESPGPDPAGLSTRRYRTGLEPVGPLEAKAITRSTISRRSWPVPPKSSAS